MHSRGDPRAWQKEPQPRPAPQRPRAGGRQCYPGTDREPEQGGRLPLVPHARQTGVPLPFSLKISLRFGVASGLQRRPDGAESVAPSPSYASLLPDTARSTPHKATGAPLAQAGLVLVRDSWKPPGLQPSASCPLRRVGDGFQPPPVSCDQQFGEAPAGEVFCRQSGMVCCFRVMSLGLWVLKRACRVESRLLPSVLLHAVCHGLRP